MNGRYVVGTELSLLFERQDGKNWVYFWIDRAQFVHCVATQLIVPDFRYVIVRTRFQIREKDETRERTSSAQFKPKVGVWLAWNTAVQELSSRQEADSSAHLNKRSRQHQVSSNFRFDQHSPMAVYRCFRKLHGHVFCLTV